MPDTISAQVDAAALQDVHDTLSSLSTMLPQGSARIITLSLARLRGAVVPIQPSVPAAAPRGVAEGGPGPEA